MLASHDPLHPQSFLHPGETLAWSGRPGAPLPLSGLLKAIRVAGYVLLACFAIFAAFGWANRDDLDGAGGILAGFLGLSLLGAIFLIWGMPWIARRGLSQTRYGVTDERVMIVHGMGGPRVNMIRVRAEADIDIRPTSGGLNDVVFGRETEMLYTPAVPTLDPTNRTPILRLLKFEALTEADAQQAAQALREIKGKGGEGPIHELREI